MEGVVPRHHYLTNQARTRFETHVQRFGPQSFRVNENHEPLADSWNHALRAMGAIGFREHKSRRLSIRHLSWW